MNQKQLLIVLFSITAGILTDAFQSPSSFRKCFRICDDDANDVTNKFSVGDSSCQLLSATRREFIQKGIMSCGSAFVMFPLASFADTETTTDTQQPSAAYVSPPNQKFSYTVTPPPSFTSSNKPLKTHLDEILFSPPEVRGYTLGVTVDPVRIKSIREFGTPEEVAARVVTAEVNRDGVFEVTLAKDPVEDQNGGCYDIEYISSGKRGVKRFVTRIYIKDGFLYVLTVQSKNDEYDKQREKDVMASVNSFRPL